MLDIYLCWDRNHDVHVWTLSGELLPIYQGEGRQVFAVFLAMWLLGCRRSTTHPLVWHRPVRNRSKPIPRPGVSISSRTTTRSRLSA